MENLMIKTIFNFALVFCCFLSINGEIDSGMEKFLFPEDLFKIKTVISISLKSIDQTLKIYCI